MTLPSYCRGHVIEQRDMDVAQSHNGQDRERTKLEQCQKELELYRESEPDEEPMVAVTADKG